MLAIYLLLLYFQGMLLIGTLHLNFQSLESTEVSFKFMVLHIGARVHHIREAI